MDCMQYTVTSMVATAHKYYFMLNINNGSHVNW